MQIKVLKSKRIILATKIAGIRHKLMQIMFSKKDGSIYISFPYFRDSHGLLSLVTMPKDLVPPYTVSLLPGGKVTSHRVKYSHHPDGRAHFSQDGKVRTKIIKQSVPITEMHGHFFTAHIQGVHAFQPSPERVPSNSRKATVDVFIAAFEPASIKIVGRMYSKNDLAKKRVGNVEGPIVPTVTDSGEVGIAVLIGDPVKRPDEMVMMINCCPMPKFDQDNNSSLTFMGGFDSPEIVKNIKMETSHLALTYPASDYDDLRKQLGEIDL